MLLFGDFVYCFELQVNQTLNYVHFKVGLHKTVCSWMVADSDFKINGTFI
jgi:hypothetical protein